MKIFVSRGSDGIGSLRIESAPAPGPLGAGQLRIAMRAASINYRDLLMIAGRSGAPGPGGLIPVSDGAGEVIEAAPDVTRARRGDRVALAHYPDWIGGPFRMPARGGRGSNALAGVMREEIVVHESEAVLLPPHLSFEEGATYPCAAVTAWQALCGAAPLLPGMCVLLQGGGGVSVFALQFAKLFGARVIMTSSSAERCARLGELGADETIDYRAEPEWNRIVRTLTGGAGADLTLDIGGAETMERSLAATRLGGRLALVGLLTGVPQADVSPLTASVDITPIRVGSRDDLEAIFRAVAFHRLRPVIAERFGFDALPDALRCLQGGRHLGKIVISFD